MADHYYFKVKVCLVGDIAVGKTSLIRRYVMDIFDDRYISTLGTKVSKKHLIINHEDKEIDLTLSIWDILGEKEFKNIHAVAFKGARGALMVSDMTREETLRSIDSWIKKVKNIAGDIPMILLGSKSDLTGEYQFTQEELENAASRLDMECYLTSAKFGDNVIRTFFRIGEMVTVDILEENKDNWYE